ncbi:MAG: peptide chain release factor N(5)-glutamine methyltransferase [Parvularculaceae bacterium]
MINLRPRASLERILRGAAQRLANSSTPLLDARVIAKHALGLDDAALILVGDRVLTAEEVARLDALVERRVRGESVAHIIGEKEFYGLTFKLAPGVLTPRPDSESLIEAARKRRDQQMRLRILDLGTGSGCLLCALLSIFPHATGVGVDINEGAIDIARTNAATLGIRSRADFIVGNWADALAGAFDLLISNPPYIRDEDWAALATEIRDCEDPRALLAGADGLSAIRSILAHAPRRLSPSGLIILELGAGQDEAARGLARGAFPSAAIDIEPDLAGRPRALVIDLSQQKSV